MTKKKYTTDEENFKEICQKYYVETITFLLEQLQKDSSSYTTKQEQNSVITDSLREDCDFRFIVEASENKIRRIDNDKRPWPFAEDISTEGFLQFIHLDYLTPYFLNSGFALKLSTEVEDSHEDILSLVYQIPVPLRFPGSKKHHWYLQKTRVLSLTSSKCIINHINNYHFLEEFTGTIYPESRMVKASILKEEKPSLKFQQYLKERLSDFFQKRGLDQRHFNALHMATGNKEGLKYSKLTLPAYKKEILARLKSSTGLKFGSIKAAVEYLIELGVIKNANDQ